MSGRVQLLSYGGGRQTVGLVALIEQGRLPRPDAAAMINTNREKRGTFVYLDSYIRPAFDRMGIPFTLIDRSKYATKDLWGGQKGAIPLLPVYSDRSGSLSKLNEYCSGEWKRDVMLRWAAEQPGWKERGVDNWIGISADERHRRRNSRRQWLQVVYPLLDWLPIHVSGCLEAAREQGWPEPPRSSCWMCPNQNDHEWAGLPPDEWDQACELDDALRLIDPNAFLHKRLVPLRQVKLAPAESANLFGGGCSSGMCY